MIRNYTFLLLLLSCFFTFSCQRAAYYTFKPAPSAYHGLAKAAPAPKLPYQETAAEQPNMAAAETLPATASLAVIPEISRPLAQPAVAPAVQAEAKMAEPKRTSLAGWLVAKKALKMVQKVQEQQLQKQAKEPRHVLKALALDHNLKLALIFAIVAVIASIFSYLLGLLLFLIALVFLILWISTL